MSEFLGVATVSSFSKGGLRTMHNDLSSGFYFSSKFFTSTCYEFCRKTFLSALKNLKDC